MLDAGGGNFAIHADAFGRTAQDYRIPSYPYLTPPDPAEAPNATQPGNFNGHQPNSSAHSNGAAVGASYIFNDGFFGLALTQNNALYHIPGIDGEDHDTRIDAHQTKLLSKGEWRSPSPVIDAVRFWGGVTDYKHNELGLADDTNPASDGIQQTFTNKEQEGRVETQLAPFDLRFAALTTAIGRPGRTSRRSRRQAPMASASLGPEQQLADRRLHLQRIQIQRSHQGANRRPHRTGFDSLDLGAASMPPER